MTSSNYSSSGNAFKKSQAALSAKVLLLAYGLLPISVETSVQFSSVKMLPSGMFNGSIPRIAATLEVTTTLFTFSYLAAFMTAIVPSTAGLISSSSC